MRSAFGVDHPGVIFKADDRADRYRRNANTLGALGGVSAGLGAGSGTVGYLESKGKDPMGFTRRYRSWKEKPHTPAVKSRILRANVKAHGTQAKVAGGVAAASLGLAGAYKLKQKKELSKADHRKASDAALGAATVGTGSAAVAGGGYQAWQLGGAARQHASNWKAHSHNLRYAKELRLGKKAQQWAKDTRAVNRRVTGVKGAGALAGLGVAGLGGKAVHDTLRKKPS